MATSTLSSTGSASAGSEFFISAFTEFSVSELCNVASSKLAVSKFSFCCPSSLLDEVPSSAEEWKKISNQFDNTWNFPHCLGSIDGKHILLQAPFNSGSTFFNYKSQFSIVLMAAVDADYNFIFADIGCQGGVSDRGVFKNCTLYKDLVTNKLNLTTPRILPSRSKEIPFMFVADEAFALLENIMKPFSGIHPKGSKQRIFNYRLSRARRVVENAFGHLSSVFRVLRKPMLLQPEKAALVTMTIICLHNFLRRSNSSRNIYTPEGTFDREINGDLILGSWRKDNTLMTSLTPLKNIPRRAPPSAKIIRDELSEYFVTNGSVVWQDDYA